jgi:N-methylhydantoinase A/oxoprolinase/acetone carboxylase beta subunit
MALSLGIDTGGTYTDAVVLDAGQTAVLGSAKALTTRPDLAGGIAGAIDAALAAAAAAPTDIGLVALSTTLATNALVEGHGGRVALIAIGFDAGDLARAGLAAAMQGDPVIALAGGHDAAGTALAPLDETGLREGLAALPRDIEALAVAARFATRNPAHETAARAIARAATGLPVTCSHDLSAQLNGPKRALTAVLNARLTGRIADLIAATRGHLARRGIKAPLMVVRGDGALISAAQAAERPIETILSGPAASIVGARWLTRATEALVADIGGTTTDVAVLRGGLPAIDPAGARVGPWRTMVEAVAMRTTGLGGDSAVHVVTAGLAGGVRLGPRRLVPVSLLAMSHAAMVHDALDRALATETAAEQDGCFVLALRGAAGLPERDAALFGRIGAAAPLGAVLRSRPDLAALDRLVARGLVMVAGVTPSDAAHVAGLTAAWDAAAATKALTLMARRRVGSGERVAGCAAALAGIIIAQLQVQTVQCLLEAAFAAEGWPDPPETLATHPLIARALAGAAEGGGAEGGGAAGQRLLRLAGGLAVPVVGLGAAAPAYYGAVGRRLSTPMLIPPHAAVANAIGAVAGQIAMRRIGLVTAPAEGRFVAHLPEGPQVFPAREAAIEALAGVLAAAARAAALAAGAAEVEMRITTDLTETLVEGRPFFVEARVTATATGRPRIAAPASA